MLERDLTPYGTKSAYVLLEDRELLEKITKKAMEETPNLDHTGNKIDNLVSDELLYLFSVNAVYDVAKKLNFMLEYCFDCQDMRANGRWLRKKEFDRNEISNRISDMQCYECNEKFLDKINNHFRVKKTQPLSEPVQMYAH